MHATQVATPFHRQGWVYEEKVDGYRMVTYKEGRTVRLISRQGKEFTQRFPALANVAELGVESVILDTEVAVFDRQLISRFEWLRGRPEGDVATPPMLMAFDLLELDGEDQRKRPQRERRQALEHLLKGERVILPVRRLNSGGLEAWKDVLRAGYEGLVAKDPESPRGRAHTAVAQGQAAEVSGRGTRLGAEAVNPRTDLDPPPPRVPTTRDPRWARTVDAALCLAWRLLWSWRR
jgi:ATP-dependent DNA ligase